MKRGDQSNHSMSIIDFETKEGIDYIIIHDQSLKTKLYETLTNKKD